MTLRGIAIVDLLGLPPGSTAILPADVRAELGKLAIADFGVTISADAFIYSGTIRSLGEALFKSSLNWPIELPLLNVGVPFQLVRPRFPVAAGTDLEPAPQSFQLDLLLERVAIVIPGLQPAKAVAGAGVTPAHLVRPLAGDALFGRSVKIVGSGTLRIASAPGGGAPLIRFVAPPDPLDPAAPTGALVALAFEPPHFFLGGSDYGLTVDRLLYDDSESFTPAEIEARSQGPEWRGISIKEATLYFPRNAPAVGDVSVGVRDVLLGSPLGLQGEVRIELGTSPVNPGTLQFTQHNVGTPPANVALGAAAPGGAASSFSVNLATGTGARAMVSGRGTPGSSHRWTLPDGSSMIGESSGEVSIDTGNWILVAGREGTDPDIAESPAISVQFLAAAPVTVPSVNVTVGGEVRVGVLSMSGTREGLQGIALSLDPPTDTGFNWQFGTGLGAQTARGATFTPTIPAAAGTYFLTVGKADGALQRVRFEVLPEGEVLIGCRAGVFDVTGPVPPRAVEGTYRLPSFNARGDMEPAGDTATIVGGVATVPSGLLASVTVERTGGGTPPPPEVPAAVPRHAQVLMEYDSAVPTKFIEIADGAATEKQFSQTLLNEWRDGFTGAKFIVVGRCCDIGTANSNQTLSTTRATAGKAMLGSSVTVHARGERFTWSEADALGAAVENSSTIPDDERAKAATNPPVAPDYDGWLFKIVNEGGFPDDPSTTSHGRPDARRVDIYAVDGTAVVDPVAGPSPTSQAATSLRRALVPGTLPPALTPPAPRDVAKPYRVRLVVRWDSPTVTQLSDAIPTQAEITVAWQGRALPVPGGAGNVTPTATNPVTANGVEIFTFVGGWTYDPRTTATQFSLAMNSTGDPDGLAVLTGDSAALDMVATALALGPALLAGIQGGDVESGAARVAALVAAIGFAAAFGQDGKVIFHGIKVEWRQRAIDTVEGARFRLLCDYTAAIGFDFDQFGIRITANKPIKIRYRDVGIEIDSAKSGFEAFGVVYENAAFDIEDPGQWTITGPLGDLIRVAGSRSGSGSTWVELDLVFALDLGVVKITGCTLRASFSNSGLNIEFRGFSASIDLPGVVAGSGGVSIGDGGLIRAGLAATIVPINTSAMASLALQGDFVALEVGVILPVGIPLAQSGLAIYGFVGRVVSNGKRNFVGLSSDPVQRELEWYELPGQNKYSPAPGQWAMGLGISIGTMPDTGFTFNALGMLSVGFPDPDVVISIDASLFKKPSLPAADNNAPQAGLKILGVIAISPRAVVVGVRGSYLIPKVLKLELPFGAYFPLPGNSDPAFVRIGADGINGRTGDPVSLTLLPGTLDIGVWAYTMVEERHLIRLGDVEGFDLEGFSIGFGAGWSMKWGGGPIFLRASAKILAGLGTKPLTIVAGLFIEGELRLIVVSVSVRGNVKALITEQTQLFSGEFCGKVDFFFFSVEGCVEVEFGSGSDPGIPVPDHPLTRVDLTGRTGAIAGRAYRSGETQDPDRPPLAWPDTVPLLNFAAYIQNRLAGSAFAPSPAELPGVPWSGSTELKYAYRLTSLAIRKSGQPAMAGPLESVWWWPTHRGGVLTPTDPAPSPHEGRQLALLSWHPTPWSRNLADGGAGTPASPGNTVDQLCVPVRDDVRGCVRGDRMIRETFDAVRLSGSPGTRFAAIISEVLTGATTLADIAASVALAGWQLIAGTSIGFPSPIDVPSGPAAVTAGYRLATLFKGAIFLASLGARVVPTMAIDDAVLTLELCGQRSGLGKPRGDVEAADVLTRLLDLAAADKPPMIEAVFADGTRVQIEGQIVAGVGAPMGAARRAASTRRRCALVQYTAPAGKTLTELRIPSWSGGTISVVSLCGTDWETRYVQQTNADAQAGLAGLFGLYSDPSTSERPNLLDADTDYEIVVGVQWVGWRRDRDDPATTQPPPLDDGLAWQDFPEAVFRFHTSPPAVLPANPPPADFRDERVFDPRGLMRYFLGFRPDGLGAPHFLADPIKVDFRADHIDPLLAKYGRALKFKLRRTDPPAASLAGAPGDGIGGAIRPGDMVMNVVVGLLEPLLLEASDLLLVDAANEAPCTTPPAVGGRTFDLIADLEPGADYDLLLAAPPSATPDLDTVLITRGHFRTSLYADPAAMLAAMALPTTGDPDPRLPFDALVQPGLPAIAATPNDSAFETVLRGLGLDPWPLPTLPRIVALWSKTAPFRLHGIMLETDEPLDRGARMTVSGITLGGVALQRIVANTATTRMIWMAAAPILLPTDTVIDVAVSANGAVLHGRRTLLTVPRMALLEGVA